MTQGFGGFLLLLGAEAVLEAVWQVVMGLGSNVSSSVFLSRCKSKY